MKKFIDAEKLKKDIIHHDENVRSANPFNEEYYSLAHAHIIDLIDITPAADVVEVVRCKDCKYCRDGGLGGLWCEHPDNRNPIGCRPDDFCNDGEKKNL